jgi:hypothetical protein
MSDGDSQPALLALPSPTPFSARDLTVRLAGKGEATLIRRFVTAHHRLPNAPSAAWRAAFYANDPHGNAWAVAIWAKPTARLEDQTTTLELVRLCARDGAPRNTCSRLMAESRRVLRRLYPEVRRLISYQDCDMHVGTIYKADNWHLAYPCGERYTHRWDNRPGRTVGAERSNRAKWERPI